MNSASPRLAFSPGQFRLIAALRRSPMQSRGLLAQQLKVSQPAVSKQVQELMASGIIVEAARRTGRRGPPQVDLSLNADAAFALGIHADSESIQIVLLDFCGVTRGEFGLRNAFADFEDALSAIAAGATKLLTEIGRDLRVLAGACVALPARFVRRPGALNLADAIGSWRGTDIAQELSSKLNCSVTVENDANAAALCELAIGNPKGYSNFFYLYIAAGIGGAVVLDQKLYRGAHSNAGEIGALRPRGVSRPSLVDLSLTLGADGPTATASPECWVAHFDANPKPYEAWLRRAGDELYDMLFSVRALFDPEAIFVGGTMALPLRKALVERIKMRDNPHDFVVAPPVIVSRLGGNVSAAQGAAASVLLEGVENHAGRG